MTTSTLGLLHIIFRTFVPELWPLIYAKILFPFNTLRRNGQNFTKFYLCNHIDNIYVVIVTQHFLLICTRVMALDLLQNFVSKISFLLNILRTNGQILTKLYITIYTDYIYAWVVSCLFSKTCKRVTALNWCQNYHSISWETGLLLHAKHSSGAIVRFSDNSSWLRFRLMQKLNWLFFCWISFTFLQNYYISQLFTIGHDYPVLVDKHDSD